MQTITTIGLDIAKSVFQVHGVDAGGQVIVRRQLKRRYVLTYFQKLSPCLVGIEACASAHHSSRELQALGHTVRLMPPAYVKPYIEVAQTMLEPFAMDAYPHLVAFITEHAMKPGYDFADEFEYGLDVILDGLAGAWRPA